MHRAGGEREQLECSGNVSGAPPLAGIEFDFTAIWSLLGSADTVETASKAD